MQLLVQWEDEVANRQVQFSVDYSIEHAKLTIDQVIPKSIEHVQMRSRRGVPELAKSRSRTWFCGVGLRKTDSSGSISGGNSADHSMY